MSAWVKNSTMDHRAMRYATPIILGLCLTGITYNIVRNKYRNRVSGQQKFPPPPPRELLLLKASCDLLGYSKPVPSRTHDTPMFAMYRIYEHLVLDRWIGIRNEFEYFWFRQWPVASIPDPEDCHPERYAVLACIPALLISSFNTRINMGLPRCAPSLMSTAEIEFYLQQPKVLEVVPEWTLQVQSLPRTFKIPHDGGKTLQSFDDKRASEELKQKNILCWQPHIHFM